MVVSNELTEIYHHGQHAAVATYKFFSSHWPLSVETLASFAYHREVHGNTTRFQYYRNREEENTNMDAVTLSYYVLKTYDNVSPMKLQKLLYYVKVWGIVSGEHFLDATFEKWSYGPVNDQVFQTYKKYSSKSIPKHAAKSVVLKTSAKKSIDFILACYAPYDALSLSAMTHEDEPWKKTPLNKTIADKAILHYYSKLPFAKNFPFDPHQPYYPLQTDLHYAYIFDMSEKDAKSVSVYPSYDSYKKQLQSAEKKFKKLLKTIV